MRFILSIILLLFSYQLISADDTASPIPDSVRIERLAGLCELWGVVKYFHPYLAYKDIDWDDALIKTIPKVNKAETADDYKRAIQYLISFLQDPNTYVRDESLPFTPPRISDIEDYQPYMIWAEDSIAVIVANHYGSFEFHHDKFLIMEDIMKKAVMARGVIIDARCLDCSTETANDEGGIIRVLFNEYLPYILKNPLSMPSTRFLTYSGSAGKIGLSYGYITRNFNYRAGYESPGKFGAERAPKIVMVLNEGSERIQGIAVAAQEKNQAAILYEGPFGHELGVKTYPVHLNENIVVKVRLTEMVRSDGTAATHPDLVIPYTTDTTLLASPPIKMAMEIINGTRETPPAMADFLPTRTVYKPDSAYLSDGLPSIKYRILAVSKFWNALKFFYPFFDRGDSALENLLTEFIKKAEDANNRKLYVTTLAQLATRLHDSNAEVESSVLDEYFGEYRPNFEAKYVEGQTIVYRIAICDDEYIQKLDTGDILLAIDGENINDRRTRLGQYLSASTPQAQEAKVDNYILNGDHSSTASLTIQKVNGDTIELQATRSVMFPMLPLCRLKCEVFDNGYGYVHLGRLCTDLTYFLDDVLDKIRETPGLIVDMRGFDGWCSLSFLRYLMKKEAVGGTIYVPGRNSPDGSEFTWVVSDDRLSPLENGDHYQGKVIILIDGTTTNEGERYCLLLKEGADAVIIGTPTNGTAGSKTAVRLPGGVSMSYSETDVRFSDGRSIHGVGIQPDILVEPTIDGICDERDEIFIAGYMYLIGKK